MSSVKTLAVLLQNDFDDKNPESLFLFAPIQHCIISHSNNFSFFFFFVVVRFVFYFAEDWFFRLYLFHQDNRIMHVGRCNEDIGRM